jgi:hypothetical protein
MTHQAQLSTSYPMPIFLFASPVYWPDDEKRRELFSQLEAAMGIGDTDRWNLTRIDSPEAAERAGTTSPGNPCVIVALSGGVQPWMNRVGEKRPQLAVFNAYLPEAIPLPLSGELMHANAHPSSTDFFAACRMEGKQVRWLGSISHLKAYADAWQAVCRLRAARFLKIGETEPWVINSCRDPQTIAETIGSTVIPLERETLYATYRTISDQEAADEASSWDSRTQALLDIGYADILKACKVTVAMRRALESHQADGLSMACFAMIGDLDTTSCLALSSLNDSANAIGACEGDLDAAVTLFLLKALGADFVWIANPIIHSGNHIDLVHCTAPTCACGSPLSYSLMHHHESGRGVSPEVALPGDRTASAVRLSINHKAIACHVGLTEHQDKLPACHTQIRLHVQSSQAVIDSLLGTHLVLRYGDFGTALSFASDFLGFPCHCTGRGQPLDFG